MALLRLLGDIHADFRRYSELIECESPTVQIGDFGFGFAEPPPLQPKDRFIRGNHDSPDLCRIHPNFIQDGSFEDGVLFVGGAYSIDWRWRLPGRSWWADEQLSQNELSLIVESAKDQKPWLIVSHDAPDSAINSNLLPAYKPRLSTRTSAALDEIFLSAPPKLWVFGHWHITIRFTLGDTEFQCSGINDYVDIDLDSKSILEVQ